MRPWVRRVRTAIEHFPVVLPVPRHSDDCGGGDDPADNELVLEGPEETVLGHLLERDDSTTSVQLLAVAVWEREREHRDAGPDDLPIETVQDCLTDDHLPALDREGLIEYDHLEGTVALAAPPAEVEQYLPESGSGSQSDA